MGTGFYGNESDEMQEQEVEQEYEEVEGITEPETIEAFEQMLDKTQLLYLLPEEVIVDEEVLAARPMYQPMEELEEIRSLADSMLRDSQLEPIVVRPNDIGYHLIAGRRRLDAAMLINTERGKDEEKFRLKAIVSEKQNPEDVFQLAVTETIKRK